MKLEFNNIFDSFVPDKRKAKCMEMLADLLGELVFRVSKENYDKLVLIMLEGMERKDNPTEQTAQQYIAKLESRIKELEDTAISMEAILVSKDKEILYLRNNYAYVHKHRELKVFY